MNVYEGMFLLESGRFSRDPDGVSGQIPAMVEEFGGKMLVSRLWEERRLAYPINGHRKGTYWLTYFQIDGQRISEIRRKCQLSDSVLRVLCLKVDPRIVDTLVEHAKSGHARPRPPVADDLPVIDDDVAAVVAAVDLDDDGAEFSGDL
jgi:small subunit ribosomal protein S6